MSSRFGKSHNDDNGHPPRVGRSDGRSICDRCGEPLWWVRTARHRIPYEKAIYSFRDHRSLCRIYVERIQKGEVVQHRVTPVRAFTNRLVAAAVRDGKRLRPRKAHKARSSRVESVAHVPATQAGEQMTRRAVAQATASPSTNPYPLAVQW